MVINNNKFMTYKVSKIKKKTHTEEYFIKYTVGTKTFLIKKI